MINIDKGRGRKRKRKKEKYRGRKRNTCKVREIQRKEEKERA